MRIILTLLITPLLSLAQSVALSVSPSSVTAGSGVTLTLTFTDSSPSANVAGLQWQIALPGGLSAGTPVAGAAAQAAGKTISYNPANGYTILAGINSTTIGSGIVATIPIAVSSGASSGAAVISFGAGLPLLGSTVAGGGVTVSGNTVTLTVLAGSSGGSSSSSTATRLLDTRYDLHGKPDNATCTITWPYFTEQSGKAVGGGHRIIQIDNGVVDMWLEPTVGSSPAVNYSVQCVSAGASAIQSETWAVPSSSLAVTLAMVRVANPSAGGGSGAAYGGNFADGVSPAGVIDGTNTTFSIPNTPNPLASLLLFVNGLLMKQGVDYTVTGTTITFLAASTPQSGDLVLAWYRY